jgi:hypothetical protein
MILVSFDIIQASVESQNQVVKGFVQEVPRYGEMVFLFIGGIRVMTQVIEVTHTPSLNLNNFPLVSVRVRVITPSELQLQNEGV